MARLAELFDAIHVASKLGGSGRARDCMLLLGVCIMQRHRPMVIKLVRLVHS